MKLSNLNTIWGINISNIKDEHRKYTLVTSIIVFFDILVMAIATYFLYKANSNMESYMACMFGISLLAFGVHSVLANPDRHRVYNFYHKYRNCELIEESFDIDAQRLYSLIYCIGFRRLKADKDLEYYKEIILNYCFLDTSNSSKFYKNLAHYKSETGSLVIYKISRGKKSYFIDFKDNIYSSIEEKEI